MERRKQAHKVASDFVKSLDAQALAELRVMLGLRSYDSIERIICEYTAYTLISQSA